MFTVIIAEKDIIDGIDRYRLFLNPLLQRGDIAFCEWNRQGESLEAMVPALFSTIAKQSDWRAVIVQSAGRHQKNPFDYTGYGENGGISYKKDWDKMLGRRVKRFACYDEAIKNPLAKLTLSLCGVPSLNSVIDDRGLYDSIISGDTHIGEMMLSKQLEQINISELARDFAGERKPMLAQFIDESRQPELMGRISDKNAAAIIETIGLDKLVRFIKTIGGEDPRFSDPEYAEFLLENTKKAEVFGTLSPAFDYKNLMPSEVVCVAMRTYDSEEYDTKIQWKSYNDLEYSRFAEFNLYADKLKFIAFDVEDDDHAHFDYDFIRFLCFVLILSGNEIPAGAMAKNRMYCADCENDTKALSILLSAHDAKLQKTIFRLRKMQEDALALDNRKSSSASFIKMLESPVSIMLLLDEDVNIDALKVKYDQLGLAQDCPSDEHAYFEWQYWSLRKKFQQYLKQPRRALIRAADDLRHVNSIEDREALYLSGFQIDDVVDNINEAEQNMVSTVTANIYNTSRYTEKMEEARHVVDNGIETRMSRRAAVLSGIIAIAAYLLGFVPLVISAFNTAGSFSFSVLFALIACGVFAICGVVCLFILRHRLINRFKHFNYVMSGIVGEITEVMHQFSKYLTYACTFMRGFSVMNQIKEYERAGTVEFKVYKKHINDIQKIREEFQALFNEIDLTHDVDFSDIDEYEYDFTKAANYSFGLPFEESPACEIEFMQKGNMIDLPVSYIKSITLKREELYDI